MEQVSEEQLLKRLRGEVGARVREAIAARTAGPSSSQPLRAAFDAAGFPGGCVDSPDKLGPTCRTLASLVADWVDCDLAVFAIPRTVWARRRWLGFDPPTVAEREVDYVLYGSPRRAPMYRALADLRGDLPQLQRLVRDLPLTDRLSAIAGFAFECYYGVSPGLYLPRIDPAEITAEAGPWAVEFAERLTADFMYHAGRAEPRADALEKDVRFAIFLALARSKTIAAPRWDWLFPMCNVWSAELEEILGLLPKPRKNQTIVQGLNEPLVTPLSLIEPLLTRFPSPEVLSVLLQAADNESGCVMSEDQRKDLARIIKLLAPHPDLAAIAREHLERLPVLPKLRMRRELELKSATTIPALVRAQLRTLGAGGSAGNQGARIDEAGASASFDFVTLYEIEDEQGEPAYDVLSCLSGLSGAVFKAGTTTVLGDLCQHYVDMEDKAAEEAISILLWGDD